MFSWTGRRQEFIPGEQDSRPEWKIDLCFFKLKFWQLFSLDSHHFPINNKYWLVVHVFKATSFVSMSPCVLSASGHWPSCHILQVGSENVLIKPYDTYKLRISMWQTGWQWMRRSYCLSPLSPLEAIGYQIKLTTISLIHKYKFRFLLDHPFNSSYTIKDILHK